MSLFMRTTHINHLFECVSVCQPPDFQLQSFDEIVSETNEVTGLENLQTQNSKKLKSACTRQYTNHIEQQGEAKHCCKNAMKTSTIQYMQPFKAV